VHWGRKQPWEIEKLQEIVQLTSMTARFNDNPSFENTKIVRKQYKANCQYMQLAKYGSQKHLAALYTAFPIMVFL